MILFLALLFYLKTTKISQDLNSSSKSSLSSAPYALYNIGNNSPVELGKFIETIEDIPALKDKRILRNAAG